jgi:hypothetical protein
MPHIAFTSPASRAAIFRHGWRGPDRELQNQTLRNPSIIQVSAFPWRTLSKHIYESRSHWNFV